MKEFIIRKIVWFLSRVVGVTDFKIKDGIWEAKFWSRTKRK